MKKLLLALFLVSSVLAFSARVVKSTETVVKNNVVYVGEEKFPYTGIVEEYYPNGILEVRYNLKNGQLDGISKAYHQNGNLKAEGTYKNGLQVGI